MHFRSYSLSTSLLKWFQFVANLYITYRYPGFNIAGRQASNECLNPSTVKGLTKFNEPNDKLYILSYSGSLQ